MRHSNGITLIGAKAIATLSTIAFAMSIFVILGASNAAAQDGTTCTTPDHLKCYHVGPDQFSNRALLSLDSPQFGVEPNCVVEGHAVEFCVPVCKTVISPPPPTGTGFVAKESLLDDELCYHLKCRTNNAPKTVGVEDQFSSRTVGLGNADLICAPATKVSPPPPCGFTPPQAMGPKQCGGACPAGQACRFTPPNPNNPTIGPEATCTCMNTEVPCGTIGGSTAAPMCGGACPEVPNSAGVEQPQLCRQLGTNCMCTPF